MADVLKDLMDNGYKPEVNEDSGGFEPVKGKYVCRIDRAGRISGTSKKTGEPYDFYSINPQVIEIVDGDRATNRFLKLRYNNDAKGMKKLLNDLFTAEIEIDKTGTQEEFDAALANLTDKTMNIRAWVWKPDKDMQGNPIPEEDRKPLQQLRVVKSFGKAKPAEVKGDIPF